MRWSLALWGVLGLVVACGESTSHAPSTTPAASGGDAGSGRAGGSNATSGTSGTSGTNGTSGTTGGNDTAGRAPGGSGGQDATGGTAGGGTLGGAGTGGADPTATGGSGAATAGGGGSSGSAQSGTGGDVGAAGAGEQPVLTELRVDGYERGSRVYAISENGTYVAGEAEDLQGVRGVRWKDATPTLLETKDGWDGVHGRAISADGSVVAGFVTADPIYHAFTWAGAGVELLSNLGGASRVYGLSGDGRVALGVVYDDQNKESGARWVDGSLQMLPLPNGVTSAIPVAASFDGVQNMGSGTTGGSYVGVRWVPNDKGTFNYLRIEQDNTQVADVSNDGQWCVGTQLSDDLTTSRAFRGGISSLDFEAIPVPDAQSWSCKAVATNANASVIVGTCTSFEDGPVSHPFLWSEKDGSVTLESLLDKLGVAKNAYESWEIVDVSAYSSMLLLNCKKDGVDVGVRLRIESVFN